MSPLNYLWLCSIEHFMIVLPFNYVGWEGSYCFLFFFRGWLFTARGRVRERCSEVRLRRLRILVHWPELFLNLQLGPLLVVLKVHISCAGSVMGCVGIYFGNLEFQLCGVKNHASVWKWMTYIFFVQRLRVLVSSSQVQGNSSNWVCFYSISSLPSVPRE